MKGTPKAAFWWLLSPLTWIWWIIAIVILYEVL